MITIPNEVFAKYIAYLCKTGVPDVSHAEYKKWLRYYLDFSDKYPVPEAKSERVRLFTSKIQDNKQPLALRQRAANAVSHYFQMENQENRDQKKRSSSRYATEPTHYAAVNENQLSVEASAGQQQTQTEHRSDSQNKPQHFRMLARDSSFNETGYRQKRILPNGTRC